MSMSPEDRLVGLLSRWLARHIGNAGLRAGMDAAGRAGLSPEQEEAVDELVAELERAGPAERGDVGDGVVARRSRRWPSASLDGCSPGSSARSGRSSRWRLGRLRVESSIEAAAGDSVAIDGRLPHRRRRRWDDAAFDAPSTCGRLARATI
jgi:hypothetical protein